MDGVFIDVDAELPGVRATEPAIREAATNLIDNALKYAQPGGMGATESGEVDGDEVDGDEAGAGEASGGEARRYVAIWCAFDEESGMVSIEVWNSAPALHDDDLLLAREWGVRGRAATSLGVDGSGYGLPIAEQLVALLGGQLELANAPMPPWAWDQAGVRERPGGVSARILLPRAALRTGDHGEGDGP